MNKKRGGRETGSAALRRKAEKTLAKPAANLGDAAPRADDARRMVHELQVHKVELEMQNEELRATRMEVEEGLARYTELFDFAPIGYATLNEVGTILEINLAGARLLGRSRAAPVGSNVAVFLRPTSGKVLSDLLRRTIAGDTREECDVELDATAGGALYLHLSASCIRNVEPKVLLAFHDTTVQRTKEEQLQLAKDALRDANARKDEFLAALSHELRNPLAPIRNCLYVLQRVEPGSERAQRALGIVERQTSHLARLVDDLLDVTRITRGKIQLRRERMELGGLVRATVEDHLASFEASGVRLESDIDAVPLWISADPARLGQILSNLLNNAEKFTPRGGAVKVSLGRTPERAYLRVRDTGVGIAPEVMRYLFEPFAQAPQTIDRSRGGLGLGLATTKGLVELHGGTIAVQSEGTGRGTAIEISLPIEPTASLAASPGKPAAENKRRVLVIEDSLDAAEGLRDALMLGGHDVEVAHNGREGLAKAHTFRPGVVICDIGLPGMDGYQVARAFRSDHELRDTYLVALTGYARPEDRNRAVEAGFDQHMAKPPTIESLSALLANAPVPADWSDPPP